MAKYIKNAMYPMDFFEIYKSQNKQIQELEKYCLKNKVIIYSDDLGNICFLQQDKTFKIHYNLFYRYSGLYSIKKEIKEGFSDFYKVDDDLFYNGFIKSSINKAFGIENQ